MTCRFIWILFVLFSKSSVIRLCFQSMGKEIEGDSQLSSDCRQDMGFEEPAITLWIINWRSIILFPLCSAVHPGFLVFLGRLGTAQLRDSLVTKNAVLTKGRLETRKSRDSERQLAAEWLLDPWCGSEQAIAEGLLKAILSCRLKPFRSGVSHDLHKNRNPRSGKSPPIRSLSWKPQFIDRQQGFQELVSKS